MASIKSAYFKITRARHHYNELCGEINRYYAEEPGHLVLMPDSTPEKRHYQFQAKGEIPARIGLMCGDCLQNLRSSLDYLVHELVEANGAKTNKKHMFPIALTAEQYDRDATHRLNGIDPRAKLFIEALQPFLLDDPQSSPLYLLDELTNVNKHRRPLVTNLAGARSKPPVEFPHMPIVFQTRDADGKVVEETPVRVWIALQDAPADGMEITWVLNAIAQHITHNVFGLFKPFFDPLTHDSLSAAW
jgi:hypothetical protein